MSNVRILKNSGFLYFRLLITLFLSFFTTRIIINALGIDDFGIYNVVAGLIIMFGFINAAMSSSTQRYLSFELGLRDLHKLKKTFTATVNIHLVIAIATSLLAYGTGKLAIDQLLEIPNARLEAATTVFHYSLVTLFFGIVQVPYQAAIISYERMYAHAYISIAETLLKLIAAYALFSAPDGRLELYSQLMAIISFLSLVAYSVFIKLQLGEIQYIRYFDKKYYEEILSYSAWNLFGAIAAVARTQGVNILINVFFGVTLNAAYAIAMLIQGALTHFSASLQQAINPQIIKCYARGEANRTELLMHVSSKYSFFLMLILIIPFYLNLDEALSFWLQTTPEYTAIFITYLFIFILIESLSNSLMTCLQATGRIKTYHITVGFLVFFNLPLTYLAYNAHSGPEAAFIVLITLSIFSLYARLLFVKKQLGFCIRRFHRRVIIPAILVAVLSCPLLFLNRLNVFPLFSNLIFDIMICTCYLLILIFVVGTSSAEKLFIREKLKVFMENGSN